MADTEAERRFALARDCTVWVNGERWRTMGERLAGLAASLDDGPSDMYGAGGPVTALEERVAALLGTEAAVFFPTGTMAQQVALRYGAETTGRTGVALHPLSHPLVHERDAYAVLGGLHAVRPTTAPRNATAAEIIALPEPVGTVMLELPLRDAGYVLPDWDELVAATDAARARGARVHLDGARLWESTVHLGHSLAEIAALADSAYVSFYKSLGGISGAALAGTAELAAYARVWRHRYGGNVYQQWPAAVAALAGLDTVLPRLPDYVAHARLVAAALDELPGFRVHPAPPHTHEFRMWLPHPAEAVNAAERTLAERDRVWFAGGWWDTTVPGTATTEMTIAGPGSMLDVATVTELAGRLLALLED